MVKRLPECTLHGGTFEKEQKREESETKGETSETDVYAKG
jgi:hypothetical protein